MGGMGNELSPIEEGQRPKKKVTEWATPSKRKADDSSNPYTWAAIGGS